MTKTLLIAAFTFLIAGTPAGAQQSSELIHGLGEHEHPIATGNAEAQKYFNQGLILSFGFNHAEAIRSFAASLNGNGAIAKLIWP